MIDAAHETIPAPSLLILLNQSLQARNSKIIIRERCSMKNKEASYKTTTNLLAIAQKHFTEHGYFDVTLEKIAEEANVTRGAIYHHFKNKQGLFIAVLDSV